MNDAILGRTEERGAPGGSNRAFGLVFAAVFGVIGLIPLLRGHDLRLWALIVAGAFLLCALTKPAWLAPLNRAWMAFGARLHKITGPLILGILFFVVITPIAFIARLTGRDVLSLRIDRKLGSYWVSRQRPSTPSSMTQQF